MNADSLVYSVWEEMLATQMRAHYFRELASRCRARALSFQGQHALSKKNRMLVRWYDYVSEQNLAKYGSRA